MMKADIVNPAAPPADRYSRWDEYVAIHRMIQNVNAPGAAFPVNFGHGGSSAYGFLPWHRYFLYLLEQRLQSYVPGVALPYWDWTDPSSTLLVASFLGPDGDPGSGYEVRQGYFAKEALAPASTPHRHRRGGLRGSVVGTCTRRSEPGRELSGGAWERRRAFRR